MTETTHRATLRRSRAAVFVVFASFGMVIATWAVHLPALQQQTDMSTGQLGAVLLILGAGSLTSMQVSGFLVDRAGSGVVALAGAGAMAVVVAIPLAANTFWHAAVGAFILGTTVGAVEVGMNAAAVDVERDYERPIMAAFHAMFSVGSVAGSLVAAVCYAAGVSVLPATGAVGVLCVAGLAIATPTLLGVGRSRDRSTLAANAPTTAQMASDGRLPFARLLVLGLLAFLLLLCEGSAMDWSSLHAQEHLGTSAAVGSLAFGAFVAAMTVGRFTADRVAQHLGAARVLRWGSLVAATGLVLVFLSPALPLTLAGWVLLGLGLSGGVPQVLTAAGNASDSSGRALSRVVGLGYVALLAGPALIGWIAEMTSLNSALLVPACAALICVLAAGAVKPATSSAVPPSSQQ